MSGSCWSRRAGGSRDRAPAGAVRGARGPRGVVAARDAGGAACVAALARLRRGKRALRQRGLHRLRARAAAVRGHRRGGPGRAFGHARRCRPGALHRAGDPLGEPALRPGAGGLGRAPGPRRRRAGAYGRIAGAAAGARGLAGAACGRAALYALGLPGVPDRLPRRPARPGSGDRARRLPPGARRHARVRGGGRTADGARCAAVARRRARRPRYPRRP